MSAPGWSSRSAEGETTALIRILQRRIPAERRQARPFPREGNLLRDNEDRYTVTGVAASTVSPAIWVQLEGEWHAVWLDELMHALPHRKSCGSEIPDLTPDEAATLTALSAGDRRGCPEITACMLGMWDETQHTGILSANVGALSPDEKTNLGIPSSLRGDWPLDRMTFEAAARLLTLHPQTLGGCHCP